MSLREIIEALLEMVLANGLPLSVQLETELIDMGYDVAKLRGDHAA